jgi:prolyl-tRNA synthetase
MRFLELPIQTQRDNPSNARTAGFALLVRAGYLTRDGQPLELARRVIENARRLHTEMTAHPAPGLAAIDAFFLRLGLDVIPSRTADEFYFPALGPDEITWCAACGYASRRELSGLRKQPFGVQETALPSEKVSTPGASSIDALAGFLQVPKEKTAKALMYTRLSDGRFVFIVIRGDMQLSEAKLFRQIGPARPATEDEITAAGAVAGYASPVGLRGALLVVDDLIPHSPNLVAGANEKDYHLLNVNYPRDFQADMVVDVALARAGDACPACAAPLEVRTVEILAIGERIDFDKLLLSLAETHHDDRGLTLPRGLAPFDVYLMNVPGKTLDTTIAAGNIYAQLSDAGLAVLYDDRDERAGVKFNDADLIGLPIRITVGERGLQNGMVELKERRAGENLQVPLAGVLEQITTQSI